MHRITGFGVRRPWRVVPLTPGASSSAMATPFGALRATATSFGWCVAHPDGVVGDVLAQRTGWINWINQLIPETSLIHNVARRFYMKSFIAGFAIVLMSTTAYATDYECYGRVPEGDGYRVTSNFTVSADSKEDAERGAIEAVRERLGADAEVFCSEG